MKIAYINQLRKWSEELTEEKFFVFFNHIELHLWNQVNLFLADCDFNTYLTHNYNSGIFQAKIWPVPFLWGRLVPSSGTRSTVVTNHYTKMIYAIWQTFDDEICNSGAPQQIIREKHLPVGVFRAAAKLVVIDIRKSENMFWSKEFRKKESFVRTLEPFYRRKLPFSVILRAQKLEIMKKQEFPLNFLRSRTQKNVFWIFWPIMKILRSPSMLWQSKMC